MRWIVYHSIRAGARGDGVIVGPRNLEQCDEYIEAVKAGPLPAELVKSFNGLWDGVESDSVGILE